MKDTITIIGTQDIKINQYILFFLLILTDMAVKMLGTKKVSETLLECGIKNEIKYQ
jgi:hypothetical protein